MSQQPLNKQFMISTCAALIACSCCITFAAQPPERTHPRPLPGDEVSLPPLIEAIDAGDDAAMEKLLQDGADLNVTDIGSRTPVIVAAQKKNAGVLLKLLKLGANPKAADHMGATALHWLAMGQHDGMPQDQRAVGARRTEVEQQRLKMADALVAAGADVNARSKQGITPLHLAAQSALPEVVSFLLAHRADVNARAEQYGGLIPLHMLFFADQEGDEDRLACRKTAELLVAKGSDLKAPDPSGDTPLHSAARNCNKVMTEVILTRVNDVRDQVPSALDRVTLSLEKATAEAATPGPNGARMEAVRKECVETQQLLLDAQAKK